MAAGRSGGGGQSPKGVASLFRFTDSLSKADSLFSDPSVQMVMSFDGQVYFQCSVCGQVHWCSPIFMRESSLIEHTTCAKCRKAPLRPIRFLMRLRAICADCSEYAEFASDLPIACPKCGSRHWSIISANPEPPFPSKFQTAIEPRDTEWGESVAEDIQFLMHEIRSYRMSATFHASCLHMVDFFRHLYWAGAYVGQADLRSELLNAPAQMLNQIFKETGDVQIGIRSVTLMEEALGLLDESDQLGKALYGHNVSAHMYSLLARKMEGIASVYMQRDLRDAALQAATTALDRYSKAVDLPENRRPIKCAEVEWLIGDIIGADNPGDEKLRDSLSWYSKALSRGSLPPGLIGNIEEARTAKLRKLKSASQADVSMVGRDVPAPTARTDFILDLQTSTVQAEAHVKAGEYSEAIRLLSKGYVSIQVALSSSSRDVIIRNYGTVLARFVIALAQLLCSHRSPVTGLALLENFRSFAIWEAQSLQEIEKRSAAIGLRSGLSALLGDGSAPILSEDDLKEMETTTRQMLAAISEMLEGPSTIVFIEYSGGNSLTLACDISRKQINVNGDAPERKRFFTSKILSPFTSRRASSKQNKSTDVIQLEATESESLLVGPLQALDAGNSPSKVRTLRVHALARATEKTYSTMLAWLAKKDGSHAVIVSNITRVPFEEALFNVTGIDRSISVAPSLSLALAMSRNWGGRQPRKVLLVGYDGDDLPSLTAECDMLKTLLGDSVESILDKDLGRKPVLHRLGSGEFDVIHFAGHGIFDPVDPLDSAILFRKTAEREDRITARDLLELGTLGNCPLVFLSACSSALSSLNASGNTLGLPGALLRLGVSGIVGTRWPVLDTVALAYVRIFYKRLFSGVRPGAACAAARQAVRENSTDVDDWTSFLFVGAS